MDERLEQWKGEYGAGHSKEFLKRAYITIDSQARSLRIHPEYVLKALEGLTLKLDPTMPESEPGDLVYKGNYADIIRAKAPDTYRVQRKDFFDAVKKHCPEIEPYFAKFIMPDIDVIVFNKDAIQSIVD